MNGDLISRSVLINRLRGNVLIDVAPELEKAIKDQPISYDLDKVIEHAIVLTANHRHNFCGTVQVEHCVQYEDCECCMADAIIKIVKRGGVENGVDRSIKKYIRK